MARRRRGAAEVRRRRIVALAILIALLLLAFGGGYLLATSGDAGSQASGSAIPTRTHSPASAYGAEWYGSAEDICRVHAALQAGAVGKAAPVKQILAANPDRV